MKIETLQQLFVEQLRDLYDAESRLLKALPKMAKAATHPELKAAFETHLEETKGQVERLKQVFKLEDTAARRKTCKAMEGLIAEGEETIEEDAEPAVKDAALIASAQRVEHYEIAGYGTLMAYAKLLNEGEALQLLKLTLEEEKATDAKLSALAESVINLDAAVA